jgi:Tat protein secretion system quality control protein TatD with DNase activity
VVLTAARLAALRSIPLALVEQATTANARRVLRLPA